MKRGFEELPKTNQAIISTKALMQFGFPRDRQLRYADFVRLRPAQKRGRAFMYLKLATLYTKYCRTYRPKFLRTVGMVLAPARSFSPRT
mgnify:CR=1 FL=1